MSEKIEDQTDETSRRIRAENKEKQDRSLMLMRTSQDAFKFLSEEGLFDFTEERASIFSGVIMLNNGALGKDQAVEAKFVAIKEPSGDYRLINASYYRINVATDRRNIMEDVICTDNDEDYTPGPDHGFKSEDIAFSLMTAMDELSEKKKT